LFLLLIEQAVDSRTEQGMDIELALSKGKVKLQYEQVSDLRDLSQSLAGKCRDGTEQKNPVPNGNRARQDLTMI
jgi:hypothetical protein